MQPNYYQKIRNEFLEPAGLINKELTFGCEVKLKRYEKVWEEGKGEYLEPHGTSNAIATDFPSAFLINYFLTAVGEYDDNSQAFSHMEYGDKLYTLNEIIGHPYDLREVMRWFGQVKVDGEELGRDFFFRCNGEPRRLPKEDGTWNYCKIDLSKPLKYQDLKELYELMVEVSKS